MKKPAYINTADVEVIDLVPVEKRSVDLLHPVKKDSAQVDDAHSEKKEAAEYIDYPYNIDSLLTFFEDNTWHNACCHVKAQVVCGGFDIVSENKDKKADAEHKKLKEFLDNPNKRGESIYDLFNRFWLDFEATGNAYFEIVRNRINEIGEIYHIPAHRIRKAKTKNGYFQVKGVMVKEAQYFRKYGEKK